MASIQSVTAIPASVPPTPVVRKPQVAPAATAAAPAQPTIAQLLEETTFELSQQAQEGNSQAAQLLAQRQAANALSSPAAATGVHRIDILA
jgi:hypothetical protein